jgi:hypothetical protein
MAMNTPYLTSDTRSLGSVNTPYILTGATAFNSDVSSTGTLFVGGNALLQSKAVVTSNLSAQAFLDNSQTTQAEFLSFNTTASATSAILPAGAFGIYFVSATSARLCFRSGVTTYTWIATTGAVL